MTDTPTRLKQTALAHFAHFGYEGASINEIAREVGIKTPSVYAHFKGKEELFLTVLQEIAADEIRFITHWFADNADEPLADRLRHLLLRYKELYEQDVKTKFWLRMSFFPPEHLHDRVMELLYNYLDTFEQIVTALFDRAIEEQTLAPVGADQAAAAYLCLLDGVFVEMLYGGPERSSRRLDASWRIFWRGLAAEI